MKSNLTKHIKVALVSLLVFVVGNFIYGLFFIKVEIRTCNNSLGNGLYTMEWCQEEMSVFNGWRRGGLSFIHMLLLANLVLPIHIIGVLFSSNQNI